jgi:hypothetical protein
MLTSLFALTLSVALQNAPTTEAAKPAEEKKICVTEQSSYSRIARKRVCRTERESKDQQQRLERDLGATRSN